MAYVCHRNWFKLELAHRTYSGLTKLGGKVRCLASCQHRQGAYTFLPRVPALLWLPGSGINVYMML